ncbi:hypothetical protein [Actinomyces naeslundii]|uniref:hypothetical protein n=1 Tax=Actinomyces naeslundii TaxID=1655 RepID=UPI001177940D|nr:hypothetical protein [Actinomyces naeslundii]
MLSKTKEGLSWYADRTVLLVRAIFAIVVGAGIVWYCKAHLYGGWSETLGNWNAMVANSEPRPVTIWETTVMLVVGLLASILYIILYIIEAFLPLLGFILFWFAFCGLLYWLDSRGSQNSQVESDGEDVDDEIT